ncbi:MAG: lysylphosphatidylglycerol synthase transmembrane domain-containing protein [Candidatus Beckwithbacteria bacterium]|nr:lysylphosphatidylglycerol synthase transmembrane domain-containing protein [Candidatus Beckwithbacteria bacterium]
MKIQWRILIMIGLTLILAYVIVANLGEERKLVLIIRQVQLRWVLLALIFQFIYYWLYSLMWKKSLQQYSIHWRVKEILLLTFGSLFINLTAPTAGLAGAGVFIKHARTKNERALAAMGAYYLGILMEFLGIGLFLAGALVILWLKHRLYWYELLCSGIFFLVTGGLILFVSSSGKWRQILLKIMAWWRKIRKRKVKSQLMEAKMEFKKDPKKLWELFGIGILMQSMSLTALFFVFLALGQTVVLPTVFVGYSLIVLFLIVSPTPQGIGVVEGLVPVILSSFGVGIETGLLAILIFRAINLWLPLLAGFVSLNYLAIGVKSQLKE